MRSKSAFKTITLLVFTLFLIAALSACAGRQAAKSDTPAPAAPAATTASAPSAPSPAAPAGAKETPLGKRYDKVVFQKFEYDPQIEKDYPGAVAECEKSALEATRTKKAFAAADREGAIAKGPGVLMVQARVTNLRIVSGAARFWAGPWAGSSDMSLQLKLVDAASGSVVREKELSTNNNPWAASWTWGSSDRSLPSDLGAMIAEYLAAVQAGR